MKLVTLKPSTTCFKDNNMGTIVQFWMVYMNELIAKIVSIIVTSSQKETKKFNFIQCKLGSLHDEL
jgi:hypothetical protein